MATLTIKGQVGQKENSFDYINSVLDDVAPNDPVKVKVDSPGGNFLQAIRIANRLAEHKGPKEIEVSPLAGSAGAVLALTPGAKVKIPANGLMMHHLPELKGGGSRNAEELKKAGEDLAEISQSLTAMVVARTGKAEEDVNSMLSKGSWFNASRAKEYGLVDEVTPLTRHIFNISQLAISEDEEIVNEIQGFNQEVDTMNLRDVCATLELEITDEMDDEQLAGSITTHIGEIQNKATDLETQLATAKEELEEARKNARKPAGTLPKSIINIISKDRNFEIDNLVSTGKIVPAVAEELKKSFVNADEIVNRIDEEGEAIDNFDTVMSALKKNEEVINFGGRKVTSLDKPDEGDDNPLLADAEARAKAGK